MRLPSFSSVAVGVGVLVFVAGGLWVWFGDRKTTATDTGKSRTPLITEAPATDRGIQPPPSASKQSARVKPVPVESLAPTPAELDGATNATLDLAQWEQKIDDILTSEGDEAQKAQQLLELLPFLPESAQTEAAQHLVNLLPDEGFVATGQYLTNAQTAEAVLDVLIGDLMNRPDTLKLPLLLQVASVPQHPKAGEAKELLEFYVGEDFGSDWPAWEKSVAEWLKENPE